MRPCEGRSAADCSEPASADLGTRDGFNIVSFDVPSSCRGIALTYDDGPEAGSTDAILSVLERRKTTATFFVLATRAIRNPKLLERILTDGHEVALHGFDHRRLPSIRLSEATASITAGKEALESITGTRIRWFRPPYGLHTFDTWRFASRLGLFNVTWSAALNDWVEAPLEHYLSAVRTIEGPGEIVLAHDGYATDGKTNRIPPRIDRAKLTEALLDLLDESDLLPCTLSELANDARPVLKPSVVS